TAEVTGSIPVGSTKFPRKTKEAAGPQQGGVGQLGFVSILSANRQKSLSVADGRCIADAASAVTQCPVSGEELLRWVATRRGIRAVRERLYGSAFLLQHGVNRLPAGGIAVNVTDDVSLEIYQPYFLTWHRIIRPARKESLWLN